MVNALTMHLSVTIISCVTASDILLNTYVMCMDLHMYNILVVICLCMYICTYIATYACMHVYVLTYVCMYT